MRDMRITGLDTALDEVYSNERGSWNVSRIQRDADAGKFGEVWVIPALDALEATFAVETDPRKVELFKSRPDVLMKPLLGVVEDGKCWLVDGHHRLRAIVMLGIPDVSVYVVPEEEGARYHVLYNGKRTAPGIHLGA